MHSGEIRLLGEKIESVEGEGEGGKTGDNSLKKAG
jgi:hypothetical protein